MRPTHTWRNPYYRSHEHARRSIPRAYDGRTWEARHADYIVAIAACWENATRHDIRMNYYNRDSALDYASRLALRMRQDLYTSPHRWQLLGGPSGYLTCLAVGDYRRYDRYRGWVVLAEFNKPMTHARQAAAKQWAVDVFHC